MVVNILIFISFELNNRIYTMNDNNEKKKVNVETKIKHSNIKP